MFREQIELSLLSKLRATGQLTPTDLNQVSADSRAYLLAESFVRNGEYSRVDRELPDATSEWMRRFSECYRDLFTNPSKAQVAIPFLIGETNCEETRVRLMFWDAHLRLLLGDIEDGDRMMSALVAKGIPSNVWQVEHFAIAALGHYFAGRIDVSIEWHRRTQAILDAKVDLFLQTFNGSMATRAALKLSDAEAFEFFTQKLEHSLNRMDDTRYRLRHTGYRAMILNQLGEHGIAEQHWLEGDKILETSESALERGQYLILRGLSHAFDAELCNDSKTEKTLQRAEQELIAAGAPAPYLVELEIARSLAPLVNPLRRSISLKFSCAKTVEGAKYLSDRANAQAGYLREHYQEAAEFCSALVEGTEVSGKGKVAPKSLVLSIVTNISRSQSFASGLSHFRLIPHFIHTLEMSDLSSSGIEGALSSALKIRPILIDGEFRLPSRLATLEDMPEVRSVLNFASTLLKKVMDADRLTNAEARLKEAERAKYLLHDLRFFCSELNRFEQAHSTAKTPGQMAAKLDSLLEGYLASLRTGLNLNAPVPVEMGALLAQVAQTTQELTGRVCHVVSPPKPVFVWTSEPLFRRLLTNIIKNALEANITSSEVRVVYQLDHVANAVTIDVIDHGPGLPTGSIEALAVMPSTKPGGNGLGIRSALECAATIGANLSVKKSNSLGTTIGIEIPLPEELATTQGSPKILVIDDSEAVLDAWTSFAKSESKAILAVSPKNSISILNSQSTSLDWVVVDYDLKLSGFTGADLAVLLEKLPVKVALSSGFQLNELPDSVRNYPFDAILSKEPQLPETSLKQLEHKQFRTLQGDADSDAIRRMRHDLRNELTPIKEAHRYLNRLLFEQARDAKEEKAIQMIGTRLQALEKMLNSQSLRSSQ